MTKNILRTFKVQLSTWAGAQNRKTWTDNDKVYIIEIEHCTSEM